METFKRNHLDPMELKKMEKFLEEYPGDSKNEFKRLELAYLQGYHDAMKLAIKRIGKALRDGADEMEELGKRK